MIKLEKEINRNGQFIMTARYFDEAYQKERQVQLCSKYNPEGQAEIWSKDNYKEEARGFLIYGLGAGYHILALQQMLREQQEIIVIEANKKLYQALKEEGILKKIDGYSNIKVILVETMTQVADVLNKYESMEMIFYQPSLQLIPCYLEKLREVFENYQVRKWNTERESEKLKRNKDYHAEKQYTNISVLYNKIKNKPIVIVSAGPSLSEVIEDLKRIQDKVFILATGRVLKMLLANGVRVDLFCIIDANEITYKHIQGIESCNVPLVFLNTAAPKTVDAYEGPKYIAYNMESPLAQEGRIESGGSVATACIDIAIKLGGNPIILIGQDLAYTNNKSHAEECGAEHTDHLMNMRKVKAINGSYYGTTRQLLSFKGWIEQKIRVTPDVRFINATVKGAYIEGCEHILLGKLENIIS